MSDSDQGTFQHRLRMLWHFVVARFRHGERYGLDFTLAFIGILASLWVFLVIVDGAVTEARLSAIDQGIQEIMALILQERMTEWVVFITDLGGTRGTVIGVILVGVPLLIRRRWWSAFGLVFATAGGGLIVWGLKEFFARARPVEQLVEVGGYAFPSGHAFSAMVFFGFLIYLGQKHIRSAILQVFVTISCFAMIILIGASRVYLNVHWLTDVLGGFFAGFAWLVLSILIVRHVEWPGRRKLKREKEQQKEERHQDESPDAAEVGTTTSRDLRREPHGDGTRGRPSRGVEQRERRPGS